MGLPEAHRLKHRQDFKAVYKRGSRRRGRYLTLRALPPSYLCEYVQIGISISQKVSKKAVIRNRIKRQIRAVMQELLPQISPGWKLVVIVKPQAVACDYEHFLRELEELLTKAEVLNGHSRRGVL
ncbi:MAG: ribonuclease P protein component [Cyanobacteria bacterium QS_8_48_54]|nr:MAG: ribonuclease P protein component [Cyanobacteria bacterium QS_8_48_54]